MKIGSFIVTFLLLFWLLWYIIQSLRAFRLACCGQWAIGKGQWQCLWVPYKWTFSNINKSIYTSLWNPFDVILVTWVPNVEGNRKQKGKSKWGPRLGPRKEPSAEPILLPYCPSSLHTIPLSFLFSLRWRAKIPKLRNGKLVVYCSVVSITLYVSETRNRGLVVYRSAGSLKSL